MTALVGDEIKLVPIEDVAGTLKTVPDELVRVATALYQLKGPGLTSWQHVSDRPEGTSRVQRR